MRQTISAVLLTMFLAAGCAQPHVTRFEYGDIRLDVSGRIIGGKSIAMADYKPGIYYSIDKVNKQIVIEVKLASVNQKDMKEMGILDISWLIDGRTLIAATNIKNTTPMARPPTIAGSLVNIGIGGGTDRGAGAGKCIHGGDLDKCTKCRPAGGGTGINIPVFVGKGGKDSGKVLSVRATFDMDESVDIEESYIALEIRLRKLLKDNIRTRLLLLPLITRHPEPKPKPEPEPRTISEMERTITAVIRTNVRDDIRIAINGLRDAQNEADIKKKTPILRDIPLLGKLFKSSDAKATREDMIIFITPRIVIDSE